MNGTKPSKPLKLKKRPAYNTLRMYWANPIGEPQAPKTLRVAFGTDIKAREVAVLHDGLTEKLKELEKLGYDLDTFKLIIKKK